MEYFGSCKKMIEHNKSVDINNFFLKHMGMSHEDFKNLPTGRPTFCKKHLEENCDKCENQKDQNETR